VVNAARSLLREARWLLGFLRRRGVARRGHLVFVYLQLRFLTRWAPAWKRPLKVMGLTVSYPSVETMRWVYPEIFLNRDYATAPDFEARRIIDAGANIGLATLFFRLEHPAAEIVCFEPDPRAYQYLERNLQRNEIKGVVAHNVGLGERRQQASLFVRPDELDSCQSLSQGFAAAVNDEEPVSISVEIAPLSDYLDGSVDLLKLDVEGAELAALRGAGKALSSIRRIIMEYHRAPESPLGEVLTILAESGHRSEMPIGPGVEVGAVAMIRTTAEPA
jgi:FkbM family methyltransferase